MCICSLKNCHKLKVEVSKFVNDPKFRHLSKWVTMYFDMNTDYSILKTTNAHNITNRKLIPRKEFAITNL